MVSKHFPWVDIMGKYFLFLQIFFRSRKKRAVTFSKILVHFCAKFAEKGCRSEFLSEKHPSLKKKSSKTESGRSRYWGFKICNFSGFFLRTTAWFIFIYVAFGGRICPNKLQIWVLLTISPNFKKKNSRNGVREVKLWALQVQQFFRVFSEKTTIFCRKLLGLFFVFFMTVEGQKSS